MAITPNALASAPISGGTPGDIIARQGDASAEVRIGKVAVGNTRGGVLLDTSGTVITSGTGSPEGVITANIGSVYLRRDGGTGTSCYVKQSGSGNTGWAAIGAPVSAADGVTVYNVKRDYGAVGDGSTNDTTAIQNALNAANAAGGGVVYFPPGTYFISTSLTLKSNVTMQGAGMGLSILKFSDTSAAAMMSATGTLAGTTTTLSASAAIADRVLAFTDASTFAIGDWIHIQYAGKFRGMTTRIADKSGNNVTLEEKCTHDLTSPGTTIFRMTGPLTRIKLCDLTVQNMTGVPTDNTTRRSGAIAITNSLDTLIERCEFKGIAADTSGIGVGIHQSRNGAIKDCKFDRCGDADLTPVQNTRVIECRYSTGLNVTGNICQRSGGSAMMSFTGCGHLVVEVNNIGGNQNWANTTDTGETPAPSDGGGRGIKLEEGNNFFTVVGNIVHDAAFDGIRAVNSNYGLIEGNTIFATHNIPLAARDTGNGCVGVILKGNTVVKTSSTTNSVHGIYAQGLVRGIIEGNIVDGAPLDAGIYLDATTTDTVVKGNVVNAVGTYGVRVGTGGTRNIVTANIIRATVTNSIISTASAGGNAVFANIVDRAVSLHASDKKMNDSAAADSNWVL